jgi:hypothetical protein
MQRLLYPEASLTSSSKRGWVGPHLSAENVLNNGQSGLKVVTAELNFEQMMGKPEFQLKVMTMILFTLHQQK